MSKGLDSEIQALLAQLSPQQREALKEVCGQEEIYFNRSVKKVLPKDLTEQCEVHITCRLCGSVEVSIHRSCSKISSRMETPSCGRCTEVLSQKTVGELVDLLIKQADKDFTLVKEVSKKPDEVPTIDERSSEHDGS